MRLEQIFIISLNRAEDKIYLVVSMIIKVADTTPAMINILGEWHWLLNIRFIMTREC